MNKINWFAVSNPDGKRFPEWRRSFGVSDSGTRGNRRIRKKSYAKLTVFS